MKTNFFLKGTKNAKKLKHDVNIQLNTKQEELTR